MAANESVVLALLSKGLHDLRTRFDALARQPGPAGADGRDGKDGEQGPRGAQGDRGPAGADGRDGKDGERGPRGEKGEPGRDGRDGKDGERGPVGPMPKHEWRGTELRFQQSDKRWGKWVDLRGPRGTSGGAVVVSEGGGGTPGPAWNPDDLPAANGSAPTEFIVKQGGEWVRATYAQMQAWFPGGAGEITDGFEVDGGHAGTDYTGTLKVDFGGAS